MKEAINVGFSFGKYGNIAKKNVFTKAYFIKCLLTDRFAFY
jgi:hypothetical protein